MIMHAESGDQGGYLTVGIAMVVMGALNDDVCDGDKNTTYFLKVSAQLNNMYVR